MCAFSSDKFSIYIILEHQIVAMRRTEISIWFTFLNKFHITADFVNITNTNQAKNIMLT